MSARRSAAMDRALNLWHAGLGLTKSDCARSAGVHLRSLQRALACRKCGAAMGRGLAIQETYTGTPDFPGGAVVTVSAGGPGRLIDCLKCPGCGHSITT
jgi:hypothetical protein